MKIKFISILCAGLAFAGASAFSITADEVLEKYEALPIPLTSSAEITVELYNSSGKLEESRNVLQYGNHKNDLVNTVFDFKGPASSKYVKTRVWQSEKSNKSDDKFVFEPSIGTVRRVNTTDRGKSFLGMDLTYNDMTIRSSSDDENTMLNENESITVGGKKYATYKIKSVPVKNKNVEYAYRIQYINRDTYLPARIEYFTKGDKLLKTLDVENVTTINGKYLLRDVQTMTSAKTGHKTTVRVKVPSVKFDNPLDDKYFSQNWLQTGK
ncbi:MAG: outer membrane lipoprotein-sorting protein [Treponema sp.]|nr:outer membrane lipoprotein-sorting protein [Candidatus Treponema equi]